MTDHQFALFLEAINSVLINEAMESEHFMEAEMDRLKEETPKAVEHFDHKDWKWANETIIYHRAQKEAYEELADRLADFLSRVDSRK